MVRTAILERPLFIDLCQAWRTGKLVRVEEGGIEGTSTLVVRPIGKFFPTRIADIPDEGWIHLPPLNEHCPSPGIIVLLKEQGRAPLAEKLDLRFKELIEHIHSEKEKQAIETAALREQAKLAKKRRAEDFKDEIKLIKDLEDTISKRQEKRFMGRRFVGGE